jgi:hypothetical protein
MNARRHLVGDQSAIGHDEKLNRQHADIAERSEHARGRVAGLRFDGRAHLCRHNRAREDAAAVLGNHFGLVFLELPVGIRDPLVRVAEIHAAMSALKGSYQPVLTLGLMAALGMMPGSVEAAAIDLLSTKATAVATNVPGPRQPMFLAGRRISRLIFWVPQSGDIGLGLSILSYAGQVQFGLIADYKRVPDPDEVTARFQQEFEKLVLSLLLGPWLRSAR